MQDLNSVNLTGRIANEPELKNNGNYSRLDLNVVFNTTKKDGEKYVDEGNFFFMTVWGKQAETLARFIHKGQQVAIEGTLKVDTWEKDGKKTSILKVVPNMNGVHLMGGKKAAEGNSSPAEENNSFVSEDIPF